MIDNLRRARRVAVLVAVITLLMAVGKGLVGKLIGSPALKADALHSATDIIALAAAWFGLVIASRPPTERFPYGFYRAETLGAMAASGVIIYLGVRFLREGLRILATPRHLKFSVVGLITAGAAVMVALWLYRWQVRVSRQTGSQSLAATAAETKLDMGTSVAVFFALLCSRYQVFYVEGVVTLLISVLVLWAGIGTLWTALLSLMDAAIDPELEKEVARIIEQVPGVRRVEKTRARRSGPFYFVEGHVEVNAGMDVARSHALAHRAQDAVRREQPRVESLVVHIEPYHSEAQVVLVPVTSEKGLSAQVSKHFGRAPFFLLATLEGGQVRDFRVETNDFRDRAIRAGLAVVRSFAEKRELDATVVREIGEIAFHGLRDGGVEIYRSAGATAEEALKAYEQKALNILTEPTHSSEQKLE